MKWKPFNVPGLAYRNYQHLVSMFWLIIINRKIRGDSCSQLGYNGIMITNRGHWPGYKHVDHNNNWPQILTRYKHVDNNNNWPQILTITHNHCFKQGKQLKVIWRLYLLTDILSKIFLMPCLWKEKHHIFWYVSPSFYMILLFLWTYYWTNLTKLIHNHHLSSLKKVSKDPICQPRRQTYMAQNRT